MAKQEISFAIAEVHAVALTITKILTVGTVACPHPFPMAVGGIAVLPDIHKVILVDVTLMVVGTDTGTSTDRAVGHHGSDRHTSLAGEEPVAHLTLIVS